MAFTFALGMLSVQMLNAALDTMPEPPPPYQYQISDVTEACEGQGYFFYDKKLFMCAKIREEVTRDELNTYYSNEADKLELRAKKRFE